ncbi:MAG: hypothetical protein WC686_02620 [Candidatus Shapirobacteria bacterium]|jgi:hypothetical protein
MVRSKLNLLRSEINHYLGLPYFLNYSKLSHHLSNAQVGKGNWQEILELTQEKASQSQINLILLSPRELYFFQKKHRIGIDCSGLAYHLVDFWLLLTKNKKLSNFVLGTNNQSDVRHLSAHLLTSNPNAHPVTDLKSVQTADLVRENSGKHVLFVIQKKSDSLDCVDSSRQGRGVRLKTLSLSSIQVPEVFRLRPFLSTSPQSTRHT